jgi:hypothetical protein
MGKEVRERLRSDFVSGLLEAIWIGLPCKTCSVARMRNQIRNHTWGVWGLVGVSEVDLERVREGNAQARWAARLFLLFAALGAPIAIENPSSSLVWFTPVFRRLLAKFRSVEFDCCAFGAKYRKRTRILYANWNLDGLKGKICGGRGGHCTFTHEKHFELVGGSRTKPAGVYSQAFARVVVRGLRGQDRCV